MTVQKTRRNAIMRKTITKLRETWAGAGFGAPRLHWLQDEKGDEIKLLRGEASSYD